MHYNGMLIQVTKKRYQTNAQYKRNSILTYWFKKKYDNIMQYTGIDVLINIERK